MTEVVPFATPVKTPSLGWVFEMVAVAVLLDAQFPDSVVLNVASSPVAVQLAPVAAEHSSVEGTIAPGDPVRSVTLIVFDC